MKPKSFSLGRVLMTPGAIESLTSEDVISAMNRHAWGDWGDVDAEDWAANDAALQNATRLLSAYSTEQGGQFWIISEADRSATTILLPEEY